MPKGNEYDTLEVRTFFGRDKKHHALVRNFPGLDAEMNEAQLRAMAAELLKAADMLADKNK